eukprot:CAMPEP_0114534172 /NCGR_PEP_ID=MMETSP0109-20121206/27696_1 /TAXON_ID=29199 /ORGANISM="Chlorarachnion reptans, Strain CCCM449" /LENGTH=545 /DNA_ID=CAMNT_0001717563 /DNA_START=69 /DNA_END=1706 /DNA_ORIENTATION=+
MMEDLRDEIEQLLKEGLFQSAWTLASFLTSHKEHKSAAPADEANDWGLFGDAAFGLENYAQARGFYEKGLAALKAANSRDHKARYPLVLRQADCALKLKDSESALELLKSVPFEHRPLRHSERWGKRKYAALAYQEVLERTKGRRIVLEASQALARLGGVSHGRSGAPIGAGTAAAAAAAAQTRFPFLQKLMTGHGFIAKYKLGLATTSFNQLLGEFPNNLHLLLREATLQFDIGKLDESLELFRKARSLYPSSPDGADTHAMILRIRERNTELSKLMHELVRIAPDRPEPWIVVALDFSTDSKASPKKALEHLGRVLHLYPGHTGALLAKGFLHLRHNDGKRAAAAYTRVRNSLGGWGGGLEGGSIGCPHLPRFCVFQGLVEAYLQMHEVKRALSIAKEALELMPHNPKSLTLIGIVLSQSPEMKEKACKAFRKALSIDPTCLDAVEALSRFYEMEKKYEKIVDLLKAQLRLRRRDYLHIRLGDAYKLSGNFDLALEQYHAALALSPDHREALKGIDALECAAKDESMIDEEVDDEDIEEFDDD